MRDEHSNDSGLKKELGLLGIVSIASGAMISSGLFILPGLAFSKAGAGIILSYALASVLILPAVLSKAELATAMPKAGGMYFFIDRSMGPLMGTIGGFATWFSLAFKSAFALLGIGIFSLFLSPFLEEFHIKLIAVFFCVVFALVNIFGVKETAKTQIVLVTGLVSLLVLYIVVGVFFVDVSQYETLVPFGFGSIFSTAGLIFVSFGGLTKVCSVAEEVRNPARNIPLGMLLSWGVISLLYLGVIVVTIGLVDPVALAGSTMPISLGASQIPVFAGVGGVVMAVAAILAFISTANAGLLASSRNPLAMGKDQLLPSVFSKVSSKGTPVFSIVFTTVFMIVVILFLDLEGLVKTASTLKIILFMLVCIAVIIMRESKIRNYRPKFTSPLYPWVQIVGIVGFLFLIVKMGVVPLVFVGGFVAFSVGWYWLFARDKIWREYTLLHLLERLTGLKSSGYLVDEELREILIQRDCLEEERFERLIRTCPVLDMYKYLPPDDTLQNIARLLAGRLDMKEKQLLSLLRAGRKNTNVVLHPGIAVFSHMIRGHDKFEMILVRTKKGLLISKDIDPIYAFFILVASPDQQSFYWHALMWIVQVAEQTDFKKDWVSAGSEEELRDMILRSWHDRKRCE